MIDNKNANMYGKMLGRLGCGGKLHYDAAQRVWPDTRQLEISLDGEKILQLSVTGFDVQRQQDGFDATKLLFIASEP